MSFGGCKNATDAFAPHSTGARVAGTKHDWRMNAEEESHDEETAVDDGAGCDCGQPHRLPFMPDRWWLVQSRRPLQRVPAAGVAAGNGAGPGDGADNTAGNAWGD